MTATIETARPEDAAAVLRLLETNGLPTEGLSDHWKTTIVARDADRVIGSAAFELYPDGALLRSVAVEPSMHGRGLGGELVAAALDLANQHAVEAIYLLTTTAEGFFRRFGFSRITRAAVPTLVRRSVEFTSACPSSAAVMRNVLRAGSARIAGATREDCECTADGDLRHSTRDTRRSRGADRDLQPLRGQHGDHVRPASTHG